MCASVLVHSCVATPVVCPWALFAVFPAVQCRCFNLSNFHRRPMLLRGFFKFFFIKARGCYVTLFVETNRRCVSPSPSLSACVCERDAELQPPAAAADVVFHRGPACWQRAWHLLSSSTLPPPPPSFMSLTPHVSIHPSLHLPLPLLSGLVVQRLFSPV